MYHVVTCSARTSKALHENKQNLLDHILTHPDIELADLAYSTTARRTHENLRAAFVTNSVQELVRSLSTEVNSDNPTTILPHRPSIVFAFTGQGSMYGGIGLKLFHTCSRFRQSILSYQKICNGFGFPGVIEAIEEDSDMSNAQSQLALVFVELALVDLWRSWGVVPEAVIGHSLGEYAALCTAGVLSVSDTLYLACKRCELIDQKCVAGGMLAVRASSSNLADVLEEAFEVACLNAPDKTVISGSMTELTSFQRSLQSSGIKSTLLPVSYAFHSSYMDPIIESLTRISQGVSFGSPTIPVLSTVRGTPTTHFDASYIADHTRQPVRFSDALLAGKASGIVSDDTLWLEIGPQACLSLISSTLKSSRLYPSLKSNEDDWKSISNCVSALYTSNVAFSWSKFHQDYDLKLLRLPTYAFDTKDFWMSYKEDIPPRRLASSYLYVDEDVPGVSAILSARTSEPKLRAAIEGHVINDTPVCPASVFCDMALTAAKYLSDRETMSIHALSITHPLMLSDQVIRVIATKSTDHISIRFLSEAIDHGSCAVRWGDHDATLPRILPFVQRRMEELESQNSAYSLPRPVVYSLFSRIVEYDQKYQSLSQVYLDTKHPEALAHVTIQGEDDFNLNPYWTDAMVHVAGFALNCGINSKGLYISTGFGRLQIFQALKEGAYKSYVSMREAAEDYTGDVYVFDLQDNLVVFCSDILFHKMTKGVINVVFNRSSKMTNSKASDYTESSSSSKAHSAVPSIPNTSYSRFSKPELENDASDPPIADVILRIVATECGFAMNDVEPSTVFADMGVDSLMSISVTTAVKRETGVELSATFFNDHPTVEEVRKEFSASIRPTDSAVTLLEPPSKAVTPALTDNSETMSESSDDSVSSFTQSPSPRLQPLALPLLKTPEGEAFPLMDTVSSEDNCSERPYSIQDEIPTACSLSSTEMIAGYDLESHPILIRGRPSSKETPLFLIADGAGSAASYIHLPALSKGNRVYGLESPFTKDPQTFNHTVEEVAAIYLKAIRTISPRGPYLIGGWSAGAIYAYEAARQIISEGEEVAGLILIDMRVPERPPSGTQVDESWAESAGLFTGIERSGMMKSSASEKTKQHFVKTVKALTSYEPKPMPRPPLHSFLVWAECGIKQARGGEFDTGRAGNTMKDWAFEQKKSFGPNGWDSFLGQIDCHVVKGADHFDIVVQPFVSGLSSVSQGHG